MVEVTFLTSEDTEVCMIGAVGDTGEVTRDSVEVTLLTSEDTEVCMIGAVCVEGEVTRDSERIATLFEGLVFVEIGVLSGETLRRMWVDFTRAPVELLVFLAANGRGENGPVVCERIERRVFVKVAVEVNVANDVTVDGRLFDAILENFTFEEPCHVTHLICGSSSLHESQTRKMRP